MIEHVSASFHIVTDRGCCYDENTEVMTKQGWKKFQDLNYGDLLAGLTDGDEIVWDKPSKIIKKKFDGEMLEFKSTNIDLMVTPNHNMWVYDYDKRSEKSREWKFISADELKNNRYVFKKTAKHWNGKDTTVTIDAHPTKYKTFPVIHFDVEKTGDLFELLGLWITDGSFCRGNGTGGSSVVISQIKNNGIKRIKALCHSLGFKCTQHQDEFRIDNVRFVRFVEMLFGSNAKTFTAFVPDIIKNSSSEQISRFVDGVILGDGSVHKKNQHRVIYTSSKQFADDMQELLLKVGVSGNIRTISPRNRVFPNGKMSVCKVSYVVSVVEEKRSNKAMLNKKCAKSFAKPLKYDGFVYCATVPTHRLYVRRNGIPVWCGNSHEFVRHRIPSFAQESTRYCNYGKDKFGSEISVIRPPFEGVVNSSGKMFANPVDKQWEKDMELVEASYMSLIERGCSPQVARSVLPTCLKTELVVTTNAREWRHIMKLRTSKAAHPQIREVCGMIHKQLLEWAKPLFDDIEVFA
jgi:flavin-dependent thymidylate synthase